MIFTKGLLALLIAASGLVTLPALTKDQPQAPKQIKKLVSAVDLTTLEGSDTDAKVITMCEKAVTPYPEEKDFPHCAD